MDNTIAQTILQQLGGRHFAMMTGSKNFIAGKNSLSFKLARNPSKANYCRITLNGLDLYDMEFIKIFKGDMKTIIKEESIYDNMLQPLFTKTTKLYTSL